MESEYDLKGFRILKIYSDLLEGKVVKKKEYAEYFGVHERSIQRDIKSLKDFFGEMKVKYGYINDIEYKRALGGYVLKYQGRRSLSKNEILAVCKILLESKAFIKEDGEIDTLTNVAIVSNIIEGIGIRLDGTYQKIDGICTVYPQEYFSPYDYINCYSKETKNTYTIHYYYKSWLPYKDKIKGFIKKVLSVAVGGENIAKLRKIIER